MYSGLDGLDQTGKYARTIFIVVLAPVLIALCFIIGPLCASDETEHFLRSAAIANGAWIPTVSTDATQPGRPIAGGPVDVQVTKIAGEVDYSPENRRAGTENDFRFTPAIIETAFKRKASGQAVFSGHNNTALYPPFLYLGPALADLIGRKLDLPILGWIYLGRVFNVLISAVLF